MRREASTGTIDHLEEGDLVRLIDLELSAEERDAMEAHLARCIPCRLRRDRIARWSAQVSRALRTGEALRQRDGRTAAAVSGDRRTRPVPGWMRTAAAVVLVVVLGATMAPPVRAWIATQAGTVASWMVGPAEVAEEPLPTVAPAVYESAERSRVAFPMDGNRFRVDFHDVPGGGELVLARVPGSQAAVEIRGGMGEEEVTVLQGEVSIRTGSGSLAGYRIEVPAHVSEVEVVVPGERVRLWRPDDLSADSVRVEIGTEPEARLDDQM